MTHRRPDIDGPGALRGSVVPGRGDRRSNTEEGAARPGAARPGLARPGLVRRGPAWCGAAIRRKVRPGLVRRRGPAWCGAARPGAARRRVPSSKSSPMRSPASLSEMQPVRDKLCAAQDRLEPTRSSSTLRPRRISEGIARPRALRRRQEGAPGWRSSDSVRRRGNHEEDRPRRRRRASRQGPRRHQCLHFPAQMPRNRSTTRYRHTRCSAAAQTNTTPKTIASSVAPRGWSAKMVRPAGTAWSTT